MAVTGTLLVYRPALTWPGLIIVLQGLPAFFLLKSRLKPA
jgi:hypothetical protein